jgi:hypothetical protein
MSLFLLIIKKLWLFPPAVYFTLNKEYTDCRLLFLNLFLTYRGKMYTVLIQYVQYKISTKGSFNAKIFRLVALALLPHEYESPSAPVPCCRPTASSCTVLAPDLPQHAQ